MGAKEAFAKRTDIRPSGILYNKQNTEKFENELFDYYLKTFYSTLFNVGSILIKGTGHFFETLSVGSVPGADHS